MIPEAALDASIFPGDLRYLQILTFHFEDGRWQFDLVRTGPLGPGSGVEQHLAAQPDDLHWEKR
jgi:hypothetical protein